MAGPPDSQGSLLGLPVTALQIRNARVYTGVTVAFFSVAFSLVVTRLVTRWKSTTGIASDDYAILAATCWSAEAFKVTMTVASSVVIITDVIFSLFPLTFLHHIRRSLAHRIVIGMLMSLGLLASTASVLKTIQVHRFDLGGDIAGIGISIALWTSLEGTVGIIAACLPCLRGPFLRLLSRLGIYSEFASRVDEDGSTWSTGCPVNEGRAKFELRADPFQDRSLGGDAGGSESSRTMTEMVDMLKQDHAQHPGDKKP
ncbi:hypothetical protein B0T16DRAFT_453647 [Cercophora newfieldiana]|uniref:Rhodopsin domain-containing protein n=1 Tax=Cercophora newfieldiana TaxID=92897 RepID=A0AA39YGM5_9PEZI|nr:hypothetical protein B0T16DRAFT_453647 [Cercophora newfieldiana]